MDLKDFAPLQSVYCSWKAWGCLSAKLPIKSFDTFDDGEMRLELDHVARLTAVQSIGMIYALATPQIVMTTESIPEQRILSSIADRDRKNVDIDIDTYCDLHLEQAIALNVAATDSESLKQLSWKLIVERGTSWSQSGIASSLIGRTATHLIENPTLRGGLLTNWMLRLADSNNIHLEPIVRIREAHQFLRVFTPES